MNGLFELPDTLRRDAKEKWQAFSTAANTANCLLPADAETIATFKNVFAFSDFLAGNFTRHPRMAADLIHSGDLQCRYASGQYDSILQNALSPLDKDKESLNGNPPQPQCASGKSTGVKVLKPETLSELQRILRKVRRREMLRIAFRDLAGWADLMETMTDLSAFADACIEQTLGFLHHWHCLQYGVPTGTDGQPQHLVVIAMGKLGARELNFSSDIDLIFAYPEAGRTQGFSNPTGNEEFFARLGRQLVKVLAVATVDGRVFRVDMGLRPFGESGPIAMSFGAMEAYYQVQGREWERYAWIKARVVAGDKSAGERLLEELKPYVYRRYFDFGVFDSLREMKSGIAREVKKKGMSGNIKLGAGGIREIEFFGQIFQLIRGGVEPALQVREIQKVLKILVEEGHISEGVSDELVSAYIFLRRVENRIQEFSDQQSHDLPHDPMKRERLSASMEFPGWDAFYQQLKHHMGIVHRHFGNLLESGDADDAGGAHEVDLSEIWQETADPEIGQQRLIEIGFNTPEEVLPLLRNFREAPATRALSMEGRRRLDQLMPLVLRSAGAAEQPAFVLNRLIDLLKTIEQRTSYLALLLENPATLSHLVKFSDASPWIISFMAKHPVLLDELLDPRTLYVPPEKKEIEMEADKRIAAIDADDLEALIEELCIFKQVNALRVAAADVTGALPIMKVSDRLSWIAETILDRVLTFVWRDLTEKHGTPSFAADRGTQCRGFAVIAYGKLGGLELGYDSDLDLVFLHAGGNGTTTSVSRPLDDGQFIARLGQRMVHILTAHTRAGKLYDTDMRLRPSGSSGPLVSQIEAFRNYQVNDAWSWEKQAIVRARAICGDQELTRRFKAIRKEVLSCPRERETLQKKVREMRDKMHQEIEKNEKNRFHLKQGRGGMVDIEFLAQYLVLLEAHNHPELTRWSDNVRILESLTDAGVLDKDTAYLLKHAYLSYRSAAHRLSLQEKPPTVSDERFQKLRARVGQIWNTFIVG